MPKSTVPPEELAAFLEASHADPFHTLGMRPTGDFLAVRVFRPDAASVTVVDAGNRARKFEAVKIHPEGFFEAVLPKNTAEFSYILCLKSHDGQEWETRDPYSFGRILGDILLTLAELLPVDSPLQMLI